jgi:protein-L-isoaspartate(D-aspartate) O-methyltransferase
VVADSTSMLRAALVDRLLGAGLISTAAVEQAFRAVPRHVFLPDSELDVAYADQPVVTERDDAGRPISASSQPSMMALMLEQLSVFPGQRVLEVGSGTGYNAALLAHLVGNDGSVVTLEIDPEVVGGARRNLARAGYGQVEVHHGDGTEGWPAGAPYDRIILTACAWDIAAAWWDQLAVGGRLVMPISLRGAQRAVAFEAEPGALSSVSIVECGFISMRGALAEPDIGRQLAQPGLFLQLDDARPLDTAAVTTALGDGPAVRLPTGVTVTVRTIMSGLDLWLAVHEPDIARVTAFGDAADSAPVPALISAPGIRLTFAIVGDRSLSILTRDDTVRRQSVGAFDLQVYGYGPDGTALAHRLAEHVQAWNDRGRPSSAQLRITAYPRGRALTNPPGSHVIDKPLTRLVLGWN